jgi:hypothetical protein
LLAAAIAFNLAELLLRKWKGLFAFFRGRQAQTNTIRPA